MECEALRVRAPLEFFCCVAGGPEHETVLRSRAKPSHLHAALLMLGLEPGEGVRFSESTQKWLPPHGPPLHIGVRFDKDGKTIDMPAYRLLRDVHTQREMKPMTWIFAGSRVMPDGVSAADQTGYLVSVVNFELTVIDIPQLASSANETLEWETNLDLMPASGAKVTMIIEPAGKIEAPPATQTAALEEAVIKIDAAGTIELDDRPVSAPAELPKLLERRGGRHVRVAVANTVEENPSAREVINSLSAASIRFTVIPQATAQPAMRPAARAAQADDEIINRLRQRWEHFVAPEAAKVRDVASAHRQVIDELRHQQQKLIDEADEIQRTIDELEKRYQEMTTPGQ